MPNNFLRYCWSYIWGIILEKRQSALNGELEVWYMYGKNVLFSANANYSYGTLHQIFQHTFHSVDLKNKNFKKALILGFGVGSVATILLEEYGFTCKIEAVEYDEEIIELGKRYFDTNRFDVNVQLFITDAYEFVQSTTHQYDLIIVDLFCDTVVPSVFHSQAFIDSLKNICDSQGLVFFNIMIETEEKNQQWDLLSQSFEKLGGRQTFYQYQHSNKVLIWENKV